MWLALRYAPGDRPEGGRDAMDARALVGLNAADWCDWGLLTAAGLAWNSHRLGRMLHDTTSDLPGRLELQWHLRNVIEETGNARRSFGHISSAASHVAIVMSGSCSQGQIPKYQRDATAAGTTPIARISMASMKANM